MARAAPAERSSRSGAYDAGDYIEDALTDEEAAQGYGLACQMRRKVGPRAAGRGFFGRLQDPAGAHAAEHRQHHPVVGTTTVRLRASRPAAARLPAGAVCQHPGARQRAAPLLLFQLAPGAAELEFLVRNIPGGLMSEIPAAPRPARSS